MELTASTLYVVATPIGNLEDITLRALQVLRGVDIVACEDTRHTKKLFARHEITTPCVSFHQHSDEQVLQKILGQLESGDTVALVSDAGTPCISDPGWKLVDAARKLDIRVDVVPGPDAVTAGLSVSGLPLSGYCFLGFVPHKKGRQTFLQHVQDHEGVVVFFESPYRLLKSLSWFVEHDMKGDIIIARELTKIHEEVVRGNAEEIYANFSERQSVLGEFVIIIDNRNVRK